MRRLPIASPHRRSANADYVVSGTGTEDTLDARAKLKRFKTEAFPQIMVSVNMLDTGFDYPEVVNLVMARYTASAILYQQMRGRGSRRADHIHKCHFTLFDFVGVTDYHGDDEEHRTGGLIAERVPPTYETRPRRLLVLDVNDHIDPTTRAWITLDADGNEVRADAVEAGALERGARFEAWLLSRNFNNEQERFLKVVGEQIKANAATLECFEVYRFVNPPFSFNGGIDRAVQLFGGMDALEALLHDLNTAVFADPAGPEAAGGVAGDARPHAH